MCGRCLDTVDPIRITIKEQAGVDLTNYPVKIQLESIGFTDWGSLTPESIYFLDANGNPLYFWIELIDTVNQKSIIWVKIPSLPANSQITIYMYYGGSNPYTEYHDPTKVFILFDDFNTLDTTKWTPIGSPTVVNGALKLTPNNGVMTNQVMPKNIRVRVKEMWVSFGGYGPRLKIGIRSNSARNTYYSFQNEQGSSNPAVGYYNIVKFITGSGTNIANGSRISRYNTGTWYIEDCRAYETKISWLVQDGAETVTATDSAILVDGYVVLETWDTGNDVRIDWVAIAPYVDPEPTVESAEQPPTLIQPELPVVDSLVIETQAVRYNTRITFTQYPTQVYVNKPYTYQVKLEYYDGEWKPLPNKTILFYVGDTQVSTAVTDASGLASAEITITTTGTHTVKAVFSGDDTYNPSDASVTVSVVTTVKRKVTSIWWIILLVLLVLIILGRKRE